jgi:hypothetical protein
MFLSMIPAVGGALAGIAAQVSRFEKSAARVAAPAANPDYVQETVEQMGAEHAIRANINVIKAADEMVGTLIDIWA